MNTLIMRPLIRIAFILAVLFLTALHLLAASETDSTIAVNKNAITVQNTDAGESLNSTSHICSCQILHLESSNYNHQEVAVFAEKTNHHASADYTIARSRIQKEKNLMKKMFFDKVKVVAELQSAGSCKSFYFRLKTVDKNLQLYSILDADISPY